MRRYTERLQITLPVNIKRELKAKAKKRGTSLSALIREIGGDLVALHDFEVWYAQHERCTTGAAIS